MTSNVPAVIIRGDVGGLGVSRSLAAGDVKSYIIDSDRFSAGMWSRYTRSVHSERLSGQALIDGLLELQGTLGDKPVLFNTHEPAVLTVSECRSKLGEAFRFRLPKHQTILTLYSKVRLHEFAISNGLPVPRSEVVRQSSDVERLRHLRFPVVAKPDNKEVVHSGDAARIMLFHCFDDACAGLDRMLECGEVLVQEWVDGSDHDICFCLFYRGRNSATVSMFTGRKLASNPPGLGSTAYCVAAPDIRKELEFMTEEFLDKVDYAGMGSVEYKWDRINRRFIFIEPTVGRTDWQEEIATLCGVNIPLAAYYHELELPPLPQVQPSPKVVWQASLLDRLTISPPQIPSDAVLYDGYWRSKDPLPAIVHYSVAPFRLAYHSKQGWKRGRA